MSADVLLRQALRDDDAATETGLRIVQTIIPRHVPPLDGRLDNGFAVRLGAVVEVVANQVGAAKSGRGTTDRHCVAYAVLVVLKSLLGVGIAGQLKPASPTPLIPVGLDERAALDAIL